jgi:hypothetical protein
MTRRHHPDPTPVCAWKVEGTEVSMLDVPTFCSCLSNHIRPCLSVPRTPHTTHPISRQAPQTRVYPSITSPWPSSKVPASPRATMVRTPPSSPPIPSLRTSLYFMSTAHTTTEIPWTKSLLTLPRLPPPHRHRARTLEHQDDLGAPRRRKAEPR